MSNSKKTDKAERVIASGAAGVRPKSLIWCWVGGWIYAIHPKLLEEANKRGITWIREATDEEVNKQFSA